MHVEAGVQGAKEAQIRSTSEDGDQRPTTRALHLLARLARDSAHAPLSPRSTRAFQLYLRLTLLTVTLLGGFLTLRLAAMALAARTSDQLFNASSATLSALAMAGEHLNQSASDLASNSDLMAALESHDPARLHSLLEEEAEDAHLDIIGVAAEGGSLVLQRTGGRGVGSHDIDQYVESSAQSSATFPTIIAGSHAAIVDVENQAVLVFSAPIPATPDEKTTGAPAATVLVGAALDHLLEDLGGQVGADLAVYAAPGAPRSSTIPGWRDEPLDGMMTLRPEEYQQILHSVDNPILIGKAQMVTMDGVDYYTTLMPLPINGQVVGIIAVMQRSQFPLPLDLVTSDVSFVIAFGVALSIQMLGGITISARIMQPLLARFEEENARIGAILGSITDGVMLRDPEGHIILANPAAVKLLTAQGGFNPEPVESVGRVNRGVSQRIQVGRRTIDVRAAEVHAPDGDYIGDVLVLRDMTREALIERTKDSFLDHIGHELRTPLTVIKGYADLMQQGWVSLDDEERARAISAVLDQTDILARMIDEVIDLSGMRISGRLAMKPQPFDLNALVRDVLANWGEALAEAHLVPSFETNQPVIIIDADCARLRRVLDALIDNARHFSPAGGDLQVVVKRDGNHVCLSVTDSGVGILEEDLPRVFDRFYRGTAIDASGQLVDVRGVGQGLYMAKIIVEAHSGTITVESTPGQGSTFTVCLPLAATSDLTPRTPGEARLGL